jgi:FkbM family methyltransferase
MVTTATLTIIDGVQVVVPDSLDLITPYVLREQLDWFEDEIKFVRNLLEPGQRVIDIGANYGVYALSMAQRVGAKGYVWAFEPASSTAKLLAKGIAINGFKQISLEQSALSNTEGYAQLSLNQNSELNALSHGILTTNSSETVPLVTLDGSMETYNWRDIAFVKIDAEGEETRILEGGKRFFAELSPLVQYEVKAGVDLHLELVQRFHRLGYKSYRLVAGMNILVPFDERSQPDGYLLNLFCCKPDRAAQLSAKGFLLDYSDLSIGEDLINDSLQVPQTNKIHNWLPFLKKDNNIYDWRSFLTKFPYGKHLAKLWGCLPASEHSRENAEALKFYAMSRDISLPTSVRFKALEASFNRLRVLCEKNPIYLRLSSLARVAREFGARSVSVTALGQQAELILNSSELELNEPFLPSCERFDHINPGEKFRNWVLAATLEEFERIGSFSSFYTGKSAQGRLEAICELGFGCEEMERRLSLLKRRFDFTTF